MSTAKTARKKAQKRFLDELNPHRKLVRNHIRNGIKPRFMVDFSRQQIPVITDSDGKVLKYRSKLIMTLKSVFHTLTDWDTKQAVEKHEKELQEALASERR